MGHYVTVSEVRAEGAPSSCSDSRIESRIAKWEQLVEQITGNIFRVIEPGELTFDGNNSHILHFSLPLVQVTSLKTNDQDTALNATEYTAYTRRQPPQDDRRNPRIVLTPTGVATIFRTNPGIFVRGLDQKITAKWGFVDEGATPGTYVTPPPVKSAIIELICLDLGNYFDGAHQAGLVTRETTDGHTIEYSETNSTKSLYSMVPSRIMDVLGIYRRPQIIDAVRTNNLFETIPEMSGALTVASW